MQNTSRYSKREKIAIFGKVAKQRKVNCVEHAWLTRAGDLQFLPGTTSDVQNAAVEKDLRHTTSKPRANIQN